MQARAERERVHALTSIAYALRSLIHALDRGYHLPVLRASGEYLAGYLCPITTLLDLENVADGYIYIPVVVCSFSGIDGRNWHILP